MPKKITTHLWYDTQAKEAAEFYTKVFPNSTITSQSQIHNTPSGDVDVLTINLMGDHDFTLISAGPLFTFNPSISFLVACSSGDEVEQIYNQLAEGGQPLMPLGEYPHSPKYGWTQDKYGLSWQVMQMGEMPVTQRITPTLMFVGAVCGKAEEAVNFYVSVFKNSAVDHIERYEAGEGPDQPGTVKHAGFRLEGGQEFAAMDSARLHDFTFNEAISLMVHCTDQAEIDYYWEKLSAVPESEQCGWLKDKYGVSWQVVPTRMEEMMASGDAAALARVTEVFLKMKKFDLAELERAFEG